MLTVRQEHIPLPPTIPTDAKRRPNLRKLQQQHNQNTKPIPPPLTMDATATTTRRRRPKFLKSPPLENPVVSDTMVLAAVHILRSEEIETELTRKSVAVEEAHHVAYGMIYRVKMAALEQASAQVSKWRVASEQTETNKIACSSVGIDTDPGISRLQLAKNMLKEENVRILQRAWRGHLGRLKYNSLRAQLVMLIQKVWRGHVARQFLRNFVWSYPSGCAIKLQRVWRGHACRMDQNLKRYKACVLQAVLQRSKFQRIWSGKKVAATFLSKYIRAVSQRIEVETMVFISDFQKLYRESTSSSNSSSNGIDRNHSILAAANALNTALLSQKRRAIQRGMNLLDINSIVTPRCQQMEAAEYLKAKCREAGAHQNIEDVLHEAVSDYDLPDASEPKKWQPKRPPKIFRYVVHLKLGEVPRTGKGRFFCKFYGRNQQSTISWLGNKCFSHSSMTSVCTCSEYVGDLQWVVVGFSDKSAVIEVNKMAVFDIKAGSLCSIQSDFLLNVSPDYGVPTKTAYVVGRQGISAPMVSTAVHVAKIKMSKYRCSSMEELAACLSDYSNEIDGIGHCVHISLNRSMTMADTYTAMDNGDNRDGITAMSVKLQVASNIIGLRYKAFACRNLWLLHRKAGKDIAAICRASLAALRFLAVVNAGDQIFSFVVRKLSQEQIRMMKSAGHLLSLRIRATRYRISLLRIQSARMLSRYAHCSLDRNELCNSKRATVAIIAGLKRRKCQLRYNDQNCAHHRVFDSFNARVLRSRYRKLSRSVKWLTKLISQRIGRVRFVTSTKSAKILAAALKRKIYRKIYEKRFDGSAAILQASLRRHGSVRELKRQRTACVRLQAQLQRFRIRRKFMFWKITKMAKKFRESERVQKTFQFWSTAVSSPADRGSVTTEEMSHFKTYQSSRDIDFDSERERASFSEFRSYVEPIHYSFSPRATRRKKNKEQPHHHEVKKKKEQGRLNGSVVQYWGKNVSRWTRTPQSMKEILGMEPVPPAQLSPVKKIKPQRRMFAQSEDSFRFSEPDFEVLQERECVLLPPIQNLGSSDNLAAAAVLRQSRKLVGCIELEHQVDAATAAVARARLAAWQLLLR